MYKYLFLLRYSLHTIAPSNGRRKFNSESRNNVQNDVKIVKTHEDWNKRISRRPRLDSRPTVDDIILQIHQDLD